MRGPDLKPRKRRGCRDLRDRFWANAKKDEGDGCWEWQAALSETGYGVLNVGQKTTKAHRVAWEMANGKIPEGMMVCHRCDNKKCVRVSHLFLGDALANNKDMTVKERHGGMLFTHEQVRRIRELYRKHRGPKCKAGSPRIMGKLTHRRISEFFGIPQSTISHMLTGRNWRYA